RAAPRALGGHGAGVAHARAGGGDEPPQPPVGRLARRVVPPGGRAECECTGSPVACRAAFESPGLPFDRHASRARCHATTLPPRCTLGRLCPHRPAALRHRAPVRASDRDSVSGPKVLLTRTSDGNWRGWTCGIGLAKSCPTQIDVTPAALVIGQIRVPVQIEAASVTFREAHVDLVFRRVDGGPIPLEAALPLWIATQFDTWSGA